METQFHQRCCVVGGLLGDCRTASLKAQKYQRVKISKLVHIVIFAFSVENKTNYPDLVKYAVFECTPQNLQKPVAHALQ